jgi:hypothetical protein
LKSLALGSLTPARTGDFSRIHLLEDTKIPLRLRSRVVLYDKATDLIYLPLGLTLTSNVLSERFNISSLFLFSLGLVGISIVLLAAYQFGRFLNPLNLFRGWGLTVLGLGLFICGNTLLFQAVGIRLSAMDVAAITLTAGIFATLPVSVGGLGLREGSLLILLGHWGIETSAAPPLLIVELMLNLLFPVVLFTGWSLFMRFRRKGQGDENHVS